MPTDRRNGQDEAHLRHVIQDGMPLEVVGIAPMQGYLARKPAEGCEQKYQNEAASAPKVCPPLFVVYICHIQEICSPDGKRRTNRITRPARRHRAVAQKARVCGLGCIR